MFVWIPQVLLVIVRPEFKSCLFGFHKFCWLLCVLSLSRVCLDSASFVGYCAS